MRPPLVDRLLAAVLPWRCLLCRDAAAGMDLCIDCLNDLPWLNGVCPVCGSRLPDAGLRNCGPCSVSRPLFSQSIAALAYEFPVPEMVAAMKFGRQRSHARVLGELLSIRLQEVRAEGSLLLPDVLIPVPLSGRRLLRRGFNQAEIIAASLATELQLPLDKTSLIRHRHSQPQSGLRGSARQKNIRGCFRLRGRRLVNRHVAVVDDVLTTGATMNEIVKVLLRGGVRDVSVWTVTRA